jgi:nucleoid-associated protein YgaU
MVFARYGPGNGPAAVSKTISIQTSYKVRQGDTLSSIARHVYGHASRWPALWYTNRKKVHNPNALDAGVTLQLSAWHPRKSWILHKALNHIPKPPPPPAPAPVQAAAPAAATAASDAQPAADPAPAAAPAENVSTAGMGSFQSCVINAESGGNSQVMNSTGHYGLYQFSAQTWAAHGGNPADFGHASVAEQNQVFASTYAQDGTSDWAPYDGC